MQSTHSQAGKSDSLVVGSQASEFPTSHTGASGYEGRPRSRGERALLPAREQTGTECRGSGRVSALACLTHGFTQLSGRTMEEEGPPCNWAQSPCGQASEGTRCPCTGRAAPWVGWEQAGRSGWAKAEPEGLSATCLDALPPIVSSGLAIGQEGRVGQARKHKGFLWLYCCPFPLSTLPGLPHCLIEGCPGPPRSISCCRPEPDTSYPLHHGPAQPLAS